MNAISTPIKALQSQATNVILHTFDWPYSRIADYASDIAKAGFSAVLVSPPMKSLKSETGTPWWQRYQPQDYRVIDNQLGDTQDFKAMIAAMQAVNLQVYVDVVFNHMANEEDINDGLIYPNLKVLANYQQNHERYRELTLFGDLSQPLFNANDFVLAFPIKDWTDPWEVQHGRISNGDRDPGLPTLKYSAKVVNEQKAYLKALKDLGVQGFRIDAAKHMTMEHLHQVWDEEICKDCHIFGEIITDGGATKEEYELFLQPYLANTYLGAYDFPLFHTLKATLTEKDGNMASLINPYSLGSALAHDRAITFAITHDIPNNEVFLDQVMPEAAERLAYCYLLGRDGGVPLIYADLDTSGITNHAKHPRWFDSWQDPQLQQMIHFHNLMHGLPMKVISHDNDCLLFARVDAQDQQRIHGLVALNKGDKAATMRLPVKVRDELLKLDGVTVNTELQTLTLAPSTCAMLFSEQIQ
ncbi:alpha-amylase [Photobacterium jeanii]|uniref:Alpha-amylase n=1 Tax=Photobacterium jeanii TaxID=858640 RepID=A0A178K0P5_9GAMM|nr:alpha-amylase family protein [Photobacterium jeanii]OAN10851.1 alpha-amylase [Photobacterium jeanii]PST90366.1 alpha-amylase [Photobacterium jeanii]